MGEQEKDANSPQSEGKIWIIVYETATHLIQGRAHDKRKVADRQGNI
jgi:hypothetical protein